MAIKIEFEKQERAIELPDGTVLEIPERTKENDDKIGEILRGREKKKEYEFLRTILEALFGKSGIKAIIPDEKKVNLDYLTAVYTTSVNLFYADKIEAERIEMQRQIENLEPLTDKLRDMNPLINKLK